MQIAAEVYKNKRGNQYHDHQDIPGFFGTEFVDDWRGERAEKQRHQGRAQGADEDFLNGYMDHLADNKAESQCDDRAKGAQQKDEKVFAFYQVGPAQGQGHGEFVPVVVAVIVEAAEGADHDQNGVDA